MEKGDMKNDDNLWILFLGLAFIVLGIILHNTDKLVNTKSNSVDCVSCHPAVHDNKLGAIE